jgi:plasmid maintenance system killer protein
LRIVFEDKILEDIYYNAVISKKYPDYIILKFIKVIENIEAVESVLDIKRTNSYRLHKLKGNMKDNMSISLDKKWRLIIKIEKDENGNIVLVLKLSNHYK